MSSTEASPVESGNRIDRYFAARREAGEKALMPFVCAGYPEPGGLGAVLRAVESAGAGIVEIGIPFSDPIADGPVIAAAMHEALGKGMTPGRVFEEVAEARDGVGLGLVAMVSVSIVYRMGGPGRFVDEAKRAGFDGFIFPDAPLEESGELVSATREAGLTASLLVSPSTPEARAKEIAAASSGFVYLLARAGITGERAELPDVSKAVSTLRNATSLPIACGFGISNADQVRAVVAHADAAIVGSGLVRRMGDAAQRGEDVAAATGEFVSELCEGLSTEEAAERPA